MIIHVVTPGETVYSIAAQYGESPEKIISENGLTQPNRLVVGQTIVITEENEQKLRSIAVNGYIYPNVSDEVLFKTLPNLTFLTVFTYGFTPGGELILLEDSELTEKIRNSSVAPIMLISTLTEEGTFSNELADILLNSPDVQDILIENIIASLRERGYYGLDIDFEFVPENDRELYAQFVEKTTQRLNAEGFFVFVSLAPKTSADQPGLLYEAHDYYALGRAANAVLVMTYEWGYTYEYAGLCL